MLELSLKVQLSCPWMSELRKHVSNFSIISCRPVYRGGGASTVVSFRSNLDPAELQSHIKKLPYIVKAEFRKIGKNNGIGIVSSLMCPCSRIGIPNTHVLKILVEDGWMNFHILLPSKQELEEMMEKIKVAGLKHRLEKVRVFKAGAFLTPRQEQALAHAFLKGYFEYPRPASVSQLAKDFGVSTPTYAELLRRALSKLVLKWFW
ncbi:MAG: helix-turn-helix domain-containing protein [Candidatus Caldarchaeum sp.]